MDNATGLPLETRQEIVSKVMLNILGRPYMDYVGLDSIVGICWCIMNDKSNSWAHRTKYVREFKKMYPDLYECIRPWVEAVKE